MSGEGDRTLHQATNLPPFLSRFTKGENVNVASADGLMKMPGGDESFASYGSKENGRGYCCVIANFYSVDGNRKIKNDHILKGYTQDEVEIRTFFKDILNYEYRFAKNLTRDGIYNELSNMREELCDQKNNCYDRFFLFVLSHGGRGGINTCSDGTGKWPERDDKGKLVVVSAESITSFFDHGSIPSLEGFPISFFIQSCRGHKTDCAAAIAEGGEGKLLPSGEMDDAELDDEDGAIESDAVSEDEEDVDFCVPTPACTDMLVAYACQSENVSYVGPKSWFIGVAIETLKQHFTCQHLLDMLVEVNRKVAKRNMPEEFGINYTDQSTKAYIYDESHCRQALTIKAEYIDVDKSVSGGKTDGVIYYDGSDVVGVIKCVPKKIEPYHVIKCTVLYPPTNTVVYEQETFSPEEFKRKVIRNVDFIVEENTCVLIANERVKRGSRNVINERIIGFGNVISDEDNQIFQIANSVESIKSLVRYYGVIQKLEIGGENNYFKDFEIENLDRRDIVLTKKAEHSTSHEKVVMRGKISQKEKTDPPVINGRAFQLPIFENTFTKKFYLKIPEYNAEKTEAKARSAGDEVDSGRPSSATITQTLPNTMFNTQALENELESAKQQLKEKEALINKLKDKNVQYLEDYRELSKENRELREKHEVVQKMAKMDLEEKK